MLSNAYEYIYKGEEKKKERKEDLDNQKIRLLVPCDLYVTKNHVILLS